MFCLIKERSHTFLQQFHSLQSQLTAFINDWQVWKALEVCAPTKHRCPEESTAGLMLRAQFASGKKQSVSARSRVRHMTLPGSVLPGCRDDLTTGLMLWLGTSLAPPHPVRRTMWFKNKWCWRSGLGEIASWCIFSSEASLTQESYRV